MINVSNAFKANMYRNPLLFSADVELADGTTFSVPFNKFLPSTRILYSGGSGFPLGMGISKTISIELANKDGSYTVNWVGAEITLYGTLDIGNGTERIKYGKFNVLTPAKVGNTVVISAADDMCKADKPYKATVTDPATLGAIWHDAADQAGLVEETIGNSTLTVTIPADGSTCREILGYCAAINGGNAVIDSFNKVSVKAFNITGSATPEIELTRFRDGLEVGSNLSFTGVQIGESLYGEEGYVLSVDNPLADGHEEDIAEIIGGYVMGGSFRPFKGQHKGIPIVEFGDWCTVVDRDGNEYDTFLTDVEYSFGSYTVLANNAEDAPLGESVYSNSASKAVVKAQRLVAQEQRAREADVARLTTALANSSGMYTTSVEQPDHSVINYLHNKPTLAESHNIIKITADAIGFSTDGGVTYPYGVTIDGTTIMNIVSSEGINANWITSGFIKANRIQLYGEMTVYRTSGVQNVGGYFGYKSGIDIYDPVYGEYSGSDTPMYIESEEKKGALFIGDTISFLGYGSTASGTPKTENYKSYLFATERLYAKGEKYDYSLPTNVSGAIYRMNLIDAMLTAYDALANIAVNNEDKTSDNLTALRSHALGSYFIWKNKLVRATKTISADEIISTDPAPTGGENIEEVTVADAIAYHDIIGTASTEQIPSNSDLNNYFKPGVWRVLSSAIANTINNYPSDKHGGKIITILLSDPPSVGGYMLQMALINGGRMFARYKAGSTATPTVWKEITTQGEITASTLSALQYTSQTLTSAQKSQALENLGLDVVAVTAANFFSTNPLSSGTYDIRKSGNVVSFYARYDAKPSNGVIKAGYRPGGGSGASRYMILPLYSHSTPYAPVGSVWISGTGAMTFYGAPTSGCYVSGTWVCA